MVLLLQLLGHVHYTEPGTMAYIPMDIRHCGHSHADYWSRLPPGTWNAGEYEAWPSCGYSHYAANTRYHLTHSITQPFLPLQLNGTEYDALLAEFPSITKPCVSPQPVRHTITHHICTTGPPVHAWARHLPPDRLCIARQEFEHMMEQAIITPSDSQ